MKNLIKVIVVFIIGVIAEMYLFLQQPYLEIDFIGYLDGFYVLFPLMITPLIGLVIGVLINSNIKYTFVAVTLVFSILFMIKYCTGIDEIGVVYVLAYMFNTAVGIGIGHLIRKAVLLIVEAIRERKANKE
ncbi:MAG: hypothetical protein J6B37_02590 [Clostridia bacterium]|nr:hypothetical protein [Clostridia bacterium]